MDESKVTAEFLNKLYDSVRFNDTKPLIDWCKNQGWIDSDGRIVLYRTESEENYKEHLRRIDGLY